MKRSYILLIFFILNLTACEVTGNFPPPQPFFSLLRPIPISLYNQQLTTCIFDPHFYIAHFPMFHFPFNNNYSEQDFEKIAKSQFQLLHTVIAYSPNVALFDESVIGDVYDKSFLLSLKKRNQSGTFTRIDGTVFHHRDTYSKAFQLFGQGIPGHYEHLNRQQKEYLFNFGAAFLLFYLEKIPKIHKVITEQDFNSVKARVNRSAILSSSKDYWIFQYREEKLRDEVFNFYRRNLGYQGLVLISYGASHDFSPYFQGYAFQSGHSKCLNWMDTPYNFF